MQSKASTSHLVIKNSISVQEARTMLLRHFRDEKSVNRAMTLIGEKTEIQPKVFISLISLIFVTLSIFRSFHFPSRNSDTCFRSIGHEKVDHRDSKDTV